MLKKLEPKGRTPTKTAKAYTFTLQHGMCRHGFGTSCIALTGMLCGVLALLAPARAWTDTAYRCGDAYGPSAQCANGPATPIKPIAELHTTGPGSDPTNTAVHDLRLLQPVANTPVQRNAAKAGHAEKAPLASSHTDSVVSTKKSKAKHTRKAQSPYFTAVDPTAHPKKKSTAKAAPDKSTSQP